jgi:hypothetical protein
MDNTGLMEILPRDLDQELGQDHSATKQGSGFRRMSILALTSGLSVDLSIG